MDYTQNLHLPQFAETDRIHHDDFNDAMSKIDMAVGAMPRIVTGSYTGTGEYGASHPNTLTFDFAPKLIFVKAFSAAVPFMFLYPGQTHTGYILSDETSNSMQTTWDENGKSVSWYHSVAADFQMNADHTDYFYFAIG